MNKILENPFRTTVVLALGIIIVLLFLIYQSVKTDFVFAPAGGGFFRIDKQSGHVDFCDIKTGLCRDPWPDKGLNKNE